LLVEVSLHDDIHVIAKVKGFTLPQFTACTPINHNQMQIRHKYHIYAKAKNKKKKEEEGGCGMQLTTVVVINTTTII
jgi:hypothetical protein